MYLEEILRDIRDIEVLIMILRRFRAILIDIEAILIDFRSKPCVKWLFQADMSKNVQN